MATLLVTSLAELRHDKRYKMNLGHNLGTRSGAIKGPRRHKGDAGKFISLCHQALSVAATNGFRSALPILSNSSLGGALEDDEDSLLCFLIIHKGQSYFPCHVFHDSNDEKNKKRTPLDCKERRENRKMTLISTETVHLEKMFARAHVAFEKLGRKAERNI